MRHMRGFSLLELVAVLAIFALVALIGVQAIQGAVRSSERLTEISQDSGELAVALALLRRDLGAAVPLRFGEGEAALRAGQGGFALSTGGLARLGAGASGLGRVVWRHDRAAGVLYRGVHTSLTPGRDRVAEVAVLRGVSGFELDSFEPEGGWRPGFAADPRDVARLPLGLRVRIDHARAGAVDTVVSLR